MRSADVARLAGITVRALRHYHQIGVLAEPPRTSNGYREYGVRHLVQVLRIRQLSSLGIPLEQAAVILEDDGGSGAESSGEALDQLDRELAKQIERLTRQRQMIAHFRSHEAAPDIPPDLASFSALFTVGEYSQRVAQMDRDQAILWNHFAEAQGKVQLTALYQSLSERPDLLAASAELSRRFDALDDSTSDGQMAQLIEDYAAPFAELAAFLAPDGHSVELGRAAELLDEYGLEAYNPQQRRFLELLARRLDIEE